MTARDAEAHTNGQRTHFAATTDGVTLGGTVHGQGPPLVFWHGAYGDGDLDWEGLLPYLVDRFTCYLPSWRGRGLSGHHPDVSYRRRVEDVVAFVDSLGESTGLVGWSGGASPVVAAAAQSAAVNAVGLFEPTMGSVLDDRDRAAFGEAITRMKALASEGDLRDALRAAASFPFGAEEIVVADNAGYFEAAGRYVPNLIEVFRQLAEGGGPTADDPTVLGAVSTPVLVLYGADTKPFWVRSARHVVDHIPNARMQAIPSAGHAAPLTHPRALAEALTDFFVSAQ